jgi:hypothetical protein
MIPRRPGAPPNLGPVFEPTFGANDVGPGLTFGRIRSAPWAYALQRQEAGGV